MLELIVQGVTPQEDGRGSLLGPFKSERAVHLFAKYLTLYPDGDTTEHIVKVNGKWYIETHGTRLPHPPS